MMPSPFDHYSVVVTNGIFFFNVEVFSVSPEMLLFAPFASLFHCTSPESPALAGGFFTTEPSGKPHAYTQMHTNTLLYFVCM